MLGVAGSLFSIAIGAVLTWAVADNSAGVVLIIIGAVCLIVTGLRMTTRGGTDGAEPNGYRALHSYQPPGRRFLNRR